MVHIFPNQSESFKMKDRKSDRQTDRRIDRQTDKYRRQNLQHWVQM